MKRSELRRTAIACFASNDKGIAHVINDLSNPLRSDFKSLASANFATPAAGAAVAGL